MSLFDFFTMPLSINDVVMYRPRGPEPGFGEVRTGGTPRALLKGRRILRLFGKRKLATPTTASSLVAGASESVTSFPQSLRYGPKTKRRRIGFYDYEMAANMGESFSPTCKPVPNHLRFQHILDTEGILFINNRLHWHIAPDTFPCAPSTHLGEGGSGQVNRVDLHAMPRKTDKVLYESGNVLEAGQCAFKIANNSILSTSSRSKVVTEIELLELFSNSAYEVGVFQAWTSLSY